MVRGFDNVIKAAAKSSGLATAAYLSIHDDVFYNPSIYKQRRNTPFEHVLRRSTSDRDDSFLHKALEICKNGVANKIFGLSLVDILQFDSATLTEIERYFEIAVKDQNSALEKLQEDLAKAPKPQRGDQP